MDNIITKMNSSVEDEYVKEYIKTLRDLTETIDRSSPIMTEVIGRFHKFNDYVGILIERANKNK